jgi:hypothetical protein
MGLVIRDTALHAASSQFCNPVNTWILNILNPVTKVQGPHFVRPPQYYGNPLQILDNVFEAHSTRVGEWTLCCWTTKQQQSAAQIYCPDLPMFHQRPSHCPSGRACNALSATCYPGHTWLAHPQKSSPLIHSCYFSLASIFVEAP